MCSEVLIGKSESFILESVLKITAWRTQMSLAQKVDITTDYIAHETYTASKTKDQDAMFPVVEDAISAISNICKKILMKNPGSKQGFFSFLDIECPSLKMKGTYVVVLQPSGEKAVFCHALNALYMDFTFDLGSRTIHACILPYESDAVGS